MQVKTMESTVTGEVFVLVEHIVKILKDMSKKDQIEGSEIKSLAWHVEQLAK